MVTRKTPLGGTSSTSFLAFLTYIDEVTNTKRRPFSSTNAIPSRSSPAPGASPCNGRRINGPFSCPSGVRLSSNRASFVLLSQKRKRESEIGTTSEALNSSFPFISSKGMESMVSAADAVPVELAPPMFEPVDFEHPTAHPTQSATSSALLIKVPNAWLDTGRLNSFEPDFIFASLPSIGQRTLLPVSLFYTPPENERTLQCEGQQDRYRWLIHCSIGAREIGTVPRA